MKVVRVLYHMSMHFRKRHPLEIAVVIIFLFVIEVNHITIGGTWFVAKMLGNQAMNQESFAFTIFSQLNARVIFNVAVLQEITVVVLIPKSNNATEI